MMQPSSNAPWDKLRVDAEALEDAGVIRQEMRDLRDQVGAAAAAQGRQKSTQPDVRRVNVNFSEQAYRTLEGLATRTGKSMSDVLRDAIALKAWFEQTRAEGGHVLVERPDGKVREVISV